jgi:hypothetical protein
MVKRVNKLVREIMKCVKEELEALHENGEVGRAEGHRELVKVLGSEEQQSMTRRKRGEEKSRHGVEIGKCKGKN